MAVVKRSDRCRFFRGQEQVLLQAMLGLVLWLLAVVKTIRQVQMVPMRYRR